ncbi:MAG: hypothetical protein KDD85_13010 [Parvularculaceae bacterium]|nr:hypothetical protein [Parvularculaceae bacterium]
MKRASKQDQRKVPQILREHFCEFGFVKSPQKWNSNEDDHRVSGRVYRLQAAKGHQLRIYGIVGSRHGKKTFFVGGIDPGKKSNKADKGILKRAADRAVALIGEIEGASA